MSTAILRQASSCALFTREKGSSSALFTGAVVLFSLCSALASSGCVPSSSYPGTGGAAGTGSGAAGSAGGNGGTSSGGTSSGGAETGGAETGGAGTGGAAGSRCQVDPTTASCDSQQTTLNDSLVDREVLYQVPLGAAPAAGFPAVVYFQGSGEPGHTAFSGLSADPLGTYDLTLTIKALLDGGYAVISPDAAGAGSTYWETNIPPCNVAWKGCTDDVLMNNLFAAVEKGAFGPVDAKRLYAMGISSGGFMTSRMAVSYPGRFRALANSAGSYATCSDVCFVPAPLPADHPPTLFLHGDLDAVVPITAVQPYIDALGAEGHETKLVTDAEAGHRWLKEGPAAIPAWFDSHP